MQPLGWVFLVCSLTFVFGLTFWCYGRILSLPTDPGEEAEDE